MADGDDLELLALLEELDRQRARESFLAFYMRMTGFEPPRHIKLICRLLQSMEEDKVDRAMVFAPPRHAKTTLCTSLFPAWIIGRHPTAKLMSVVHTGAFAGKIGRYVRNHLLKPEWPFETSLADDSKARDRWATLQGGEYNAFGAIGGNQHGNPAEWLFMDDLVKGRKIAMSAHMRDEIWETYQADLVSRLEGRQKQLMVFTRWNMDDPAGRILPEGYMGETGWFRDRNTGEKWFVLSLPACADSDRDPLGRKPGEWLWPERFGGDKMEARKARGGWMWSALYQQRPSPEEGLMFTTEHIRRFDPTDLDPLSLQVYITSDYAVTEEAGAPDPDWTVHQVWGVDQDWNIYLLDMWRGRTLSDRWVMEWLRLVKKWKPLRAFEEAGQINKGVGPFIVNLMRRHRVAVNRVQLTSSVSKEQRAQGLLGLASMGQMYLPQRDKLQNRPEVLIALDAFEAELLAFPTARHDDTVDAATLFARGLDRIIEGRPPSRGVSPHGDTLDDLWSLHDEELRRREDQ